MSLLVIGSVALDSIFTPFGETAAALLEGLLQLLARGLERRRTQQ